MKSSKHNEKKEQKKIKKKHKDRKSKLHIENKSTDSKKHENKIKKNKQPLIGMLVSISALESASVNDNTKQCNSNNDSYKSLSAECVTAGAKISSQVHKKVQAVICTKNAVEHLTQRVRKGLKRSVPIVDISWVRDSIAVGQRLDIDGYLLNELASSALQNKQKGTENSSVNSDKNVASLPDTNITLIEMQCYCTCHENGTTADCEWCADGCNYH